MTDSIYMVPTVALSTGLVVANFNSPHPFNFTDGTVLAACSPERARSFPLKQWASEFPRGKWTGVVFGYGMTDDLLAEINRVEQEVSADLILCPSVVLKALRKYEDNPGVRAHERFVGVKNADRVTKVVHHDVFVIGEY